MPKSFKGNVGNLVGDGFQVLFCSPDFETSHFPREALHEQISCPAQIGVDFNGVANHIYPYVYHSFLMFFVCLPAACPMIFRMRLRPQEMLQSLGGDLRPLDPPDDAGWLINPFKRRSYINQNRVEKYGHMMLYIYIYIYIILYIVLGVVNQLSCPSSCFA